MRENVEVRTIAVLQNSLTASSLSKLAEQLPSRQVPMARSSEQNDLAIGEAVE
jgi:hypothetical protein